LMHCTPPPIFFIYGPAPHSFSIPPTLYLHHVLSFSSIHSFPTRTTWICCSNLTLTHVYLMIYNVFLSDLLLLPVGTFLSANKSVRFCLPTNLIWHVLNCEKIEFLTWQLCQKSV
jgi:hypothetical protein